jgi:hypothetical protein
MRKQTAVQWLQQALSLTFEQEMKFEGLFQQAKEMENNTSKVTRVEIIQHSEPYNGRAYTNYNAKDVEIQLQDKGKTLKIFLK